MCGWHLGAISEAERGLGTLVQCMPKDNVEVDTGGLVPAVTNDNSECKADHHGVAKTLTGAKGGFFLNFLKFLYPFIIVCKGLGENGL